MADTTDRASSAREGTSRSRFGWLRALFGLNGTGDSSLRESLEEVIEEHEDMHRGLTAEERHMLVNILNFGELRVDDVMVPRADVVGVEENASLDDVLRLYRELSHSRMPIYRETLDDPIGMVHLKDVLAWLAPLEHESGNAEARAPFSLRSIRRNVLFVPPSMPALDLLVKMQATRIHLALVIDEYGGTDGLVSSIDADARCPIEDLEEMIGLRLVEEENEDDVDTLAGLVFSILGRVPLRGELVRHPAGLEFEVKDADPRRIKRMRIHLLSAAEKAAPSSGAEG
ncbi:MAG: magnesium/cobalt efflux protein [Alphaproteobacteria bacterium HGW-Alphaproteobacteria-3]|nr:MAG: magnesium/cobalt efflux protein [Alphaproteobacteria bacterium HGW-Alphaproteobacteria-3]